VDSEPDLPEAQTTPPARTPAARATGAPKKSTPAARKPAAPRQPRASTSASAAGSKPTPAAKPAAPKSASVKPATPRAPRSTTPRSTTPKSATAKPAAAKSVAAPNSEKPAVRRSPTKKTTDAAKPDVTTELTAATPDVSTEPDVTPAVVAETANAEPAVAEPVVAERAVAEPVVAEAPVAKAPAKRPARKPAAKKPAVVEPVAEPVAQPTPDESPAVDAEPTEETAPAVEETAPAVEETAPAVETTPVVDAQRAAEVESIVDAEPAARETVLKISGLVKRFDDTTAVAGIDLEIEAGSFFGIVGPNGAGKTTTLSMVTGLLRPDAGTIVVHGADVWANPVAAKRTMGVLPDRLRLFDRLTGAQLLYYSGILHGLEKSVVRSRSADLSAAFGLEDSLDRLVSDYSAGMTKKIAIAAAMIHSPRLLVLDEPFESVDPVSAANVIEILQKYVAAGGTVVMSSHTMNLIERICDSVAVIVNGAVLATGSMDEVRGDKSLEDRFVELAGGRKAAEGMEWLHKFSD
jgi:ABC-type multidrug transport system ATPase subunit